MTCASIRRIRCPFLPCARVTAQQHGSALRTCEELGEDRYLTGRVESAVRGSVSLEEVLAAPTGRRRFKIGRYTPEGLVLLLGKKEAWTPLPWRAIEGVPDFLRGRGWVAIAACIRRTVSRAAWMST